MKGKRLLIAASLGLGLLFVGHELEPLRAGVNHPGIIYYRGAPEVREVALTFDDGPNEPYTSEVLQVLRENNIRATFFLTGMNVAVYPDAAREIAHDGHCIGNHTYTHHDLVFHSNSTVRREIELTDAEIEQVTGVRPMLFRPPYGSKDFFTIHQVRRLGHVMIEWDVSAQDWRRPGTNRIVSNVMRRVHPGSIILMHDGDKWRHGSDRSQTVAALPRLIAELRKQGYTFVTVPELLNLPRT